MLATIVTLLAFVLPQEPAKEDPRVTELTRALEGDAAARKSAAEALGRLGAGASSAVPALTKSLLDSDPELRRRSAWALGRIGPNSKSAVPTLAAALSDEHVRHFAAAALGRIGPEAKDAVPALIAALQVREQGLRDVVALALGRIGPDAAAAIPAILEAIRTREQLCNVYGWALDDPSHDDSYPALIELLVLDPGPDVEWFRDVDVPLRFGREFAQFQDGLERIDHFPIASWALWRLGPAAIPPIIECLKLPPLPYSEEYSAEAYGRDAQKGFGVMALAKFGAQAKDAVPALLGLVARDELMWAESMEPVLLSIGTAAIPELAKAADDKRRPIRDWARTVLGKLRAELGPTDLPALREIIEHGDVSTRVWAGSMVRDIEVRRGK